ncbi:NUDIX domain-containing protein [Kovacikia minuta CCNUW1]|uniref:NUDIX domain-containing protein n=1 Tax=Kovacikia minuta TaxID=2931930 RepID=UPI001CCBBE0A|nr:NUDIX domain-containing protein [Kovacikia minuta]UBF25513.1 NUDIX domain-containing protein [Kovacikia minuta CCNUW1]
MDAGRNLETQELDRLRAALAESLSTYGKGNAKEFTALLEEIKTGDCEIVWEEKQPIRLVNVVLVIVISHKGERLIEAYQEFSDGRIRKRGMQELAEKRKPDEPPEAAARRAIQEELGIPTENLIFECLPASDPEIIETTESFSYPGLKTRYSRIWFRVHLPETLYHSEYVEIQPDKKTVFRWSSSSLNN